MPRRTLQIQKTTVIFAVTLILEGVLIISLRTLGWFGTGNAIQLVACIFIAALPLLIAVAMLAKNRFRFGLRTLLVAVTLVAVFLFASAMPILDYRSARRASMQLVSENATLNTGVGSWDEFFAGIGLPPPPILASPETTNVPPWLTPFTKQISTIPPDARVRDIRLNNDKQIQILVDNWQRFSSLQSIECTSGVTEDGLKLLQNALPRFANLEQIVTNDVVAPKGWYRSLTNIRTLFVWGEGQSRGKPFPSDHLADIASLPNLEAFMVLGYGFNDVDAQILSGSPSIKRVILRGTAVTPTGESVLTDESLDRSVQRN